MLTNHIKRWNGCAINYFELSLQNYYNKNINKEGLSLIIQTHLQLASHGDMEEWNYIVAVPDYKLHWTSMHWGQTDISTEQSYQWSYLSTTVSV